MDEILPVAYALESADWDTQRRQVGDVANAGEARHAFADYAGRKSPNTIAAQLSDLALFAAFLPTVGWSETPTVDGLQTSPEAWRGVTWGLVCAFVQRQLGQGYSIASVNRRLSMVKRYARLAAQAGAVSDEDLRLISTVVTGYGHKEGRNVDERRARAGVVTRRGLKKSQAVPISRSQAQVLKTQPDTPQGHRDSLLMHLLLEHGLRESEVALLTVECFNLSEGTFTFYRPKVDMHQTHRLTSATLSAFTRYIDAGDCPISGGLLRGSRRGGGLTAKPMSISAIKQRIRDLGENAAIQVLSPHDCRHYWATYWAGKVDVLRLQEAGGWNSLAMPRRYVERAKIANDGMV